MTRLGASHCPTGEKPVSRRGVRGHYFGPPPSCSCSQLVGETSPGGRGGVGGGPPASNHHSHSHQSHRVRLRLGRLRPRGEGAVGARARPDGAARLRPPPSGVPVTDRCGGGGWCRIPRRTLDSPGGGWRWPSNQHCTSWCSVDSTQAGLCLVAVVPRCVRVHVSEAPLARSWFPFGSDI